MTAKDIGVVGLRLVGLMAIVQGFQIGVSMHGFMAFGASTEPTPAWNYLPVILWTLVMVAVGVSIVAYAGSIGKWLFPEGDSVAVSIGADELRVVLFSAVGALLIAESLPEVLRQVVALVAMSRQGLEPIGGILRLQDGLELGEALLRAILGLFLLVGGRNAAALLRRLRQLGAKEGQ